MLYFDDILGDRTIEMAMNQIRFEKMPIDRNVMNKIGTAMLFQHSSF
jgi:hypothetical protein